MKIKAAIKMKVHFKLSLKLIYILAGLRPSRWSVFRKRNCLPSVKNKPSALKTWFPDFRRP